MIILNSNLAHIISKKLKQPHNIIKFQLSGNYFINSYLKNIFMKLDEYNFKSRIYERVCEYDFLSFKFYMTTIKPSIFIPNFSRDIKSLKTCKYILKNMELNFFIETMKVIFMFKTNFTPKYYKWVVRKLKHEKLPSYCLKNMICHGHIETFKYIKKDLKFPKFVKIGCVVCYILEYSQNNTKYRINFLIKNFGIKPKTCCSGFSQEKNFNKIDN